MTRLERAARRARHSTRLGGSVAMKWVAGGMAGLIGFGMAFGATYIDRLQNSFTTQNIDSLLGDPTADSSPNTSPTATGPAEPIDMNAGNDLNILLIGSDVRSGENGSIGGRVTEGMRSDATVIMHISADRTRVDLLSIPRDMRFRISDCKLFDGTPVKGWTGKFNIAFANGGKQGNESEAAACTMKTIQDTTGIKFDHYAVIDFSGFQDMVDAIGGVPMCVPENMKDRRSRLNVKAGPQVFNGKTALSWARLRHWGDGTDLGRIDRQQELLTNMFRKTLGMNVLTDAPQLTLLLKSAGEAMTMDEDLGSFTYLAGLAYSLRNIDTDNINFETVPWKYAGDKSGDVLATDDAAVVYKRIKSDIPMDGGTTESVDESATPDPSGSPSTSPSASPTPERVTEEEILNEC